MTMFCPDGVTCRSKAVFGKPCIAYAGCVAIGPEDEPDPSVNGDPSSLNGEEDESGFDDMPPENGWEDDSDGGDDDDETEG